MELQSASKYYMCKKKQEFEQNIIDMERNFSSKLVDEMVRKEIRLQRELQQLVRDGRKFSKEYDDKVKQLQNVQSRLYAKTGVS